MKIGSIDSSPKELRRKLFALIRKWRHRALPVQSPAEYCSLRRLNQSSGGEPASATPLPGEPSQLGDRKSTRLNSSHLVISYAVFCLKKKTQSPHLRNTNAYIPSVAY